MPDVAAKGSLALAAEKLAWLLAICPTLANGRDPQSVVDDSIDYQYREAEKGDTKPDRPFFVVDYPGQHEFNLIAGGGQNVLRPRGALFLYGEYDWPAEFKNDLTNANREAATYFGRVIDELAERAGKDISAEIGGPFEDGSGDLAITAISQQFLEHTATDEWPTDELFLLAGYLISWGDG